LQELPLSFFADFTFEIGVRGSKQAGVSGIHFRPRMIDARAEDLRGGQMNRYSLSLYQNGAGLQPREIDPRNHFSVHHQQQAVTRQKLRQVHARAESCASYENSPEEPL